MRKLDLQKWEFSVIVICFLLLVVSAVLYFTNVSLRRVFLGVPDGSETQRVVGIVGVNRGTLFREQLGQATFQAVGSKDTLFSRDTVMTGNDGYAVLTLSDGNIIELAPRTMIQLRTESNLGLGGVVRTTQVEVLTGSVVSKTEATDMVIKVRGKRYAVARNTLQKIRVSEKRRPQLGPKSKQPKIPTASSSATPEPQELASQTAAESAGASPGPSTGGVLSGEDVVFGVAEALTKEKLAPTFSPVPRPASLPKSPPIPIAPAPRVISAPEPTGEPSAGPSVSPSASPSVLPSAGPSAGPSALPSAGPSALPSAGPSVLPSAGPSALPSAGPSALPSALPSPSPVPGNGFSVPLKAQPVKVKPRINARIQMIFPKSGEHFAISKGSKTPEKRISIRWKVTPTDFPVVLVVKKSAGGKSVEVDRQLPNVDRRGNPLSELTWIPKGAGTFDLAVVEALPPEQAKEAGASKSVTVVVDKEFEGIEVLEPLVAGERMTSNRFSGGPIKENFDLTLRWAAYPGVKTYQVQAAHSASMVNPFLDKISDKASYTVNKERGAAPQIFYRIKAALPGGFVVRSPLEQFIFDFEPPKPVVPEDHAVMSRAELTNEGDGILFTWQKTNFTDGYVLEIASDREFRKKILEKVQKDNFFVFKAIQPGKYYWRVKGYAQKFFSKTSQPYEMVIEP